MATTKDIAIALDIDEQTVRRYAREGIIPFWETLGGHRRYDLDEVRSAIEFARAKRFEPLDFSSEVEPRLPSSTAHLPDRPRRLRRFGITAASPADAEPELLEALSQGDILDVAKSVRLYSPDVPTWPEEVEDVPHEEPVMTMEVRLRPGLSVIISQDCDLRRDLDVEPWVLLAPLTEVDQDQYTRAANGLSPRFFAYPQIEGHADAGYVVIDLRVISSLEKAALLSSHIKRIPCPLSSPDRTELREFLGNRLGRTPFPNEIDELVIKPITYAVKRVGENPAGAGLLATTTFIGLAWTPGRKHVSLLLLVDPKKVERLKLDQAAFNGGLKRLRNAVGHFSRNSDFTIMVNAHADTEVSAADMLSTHELHLDLDQLDLERIAEGMARSPAQATHDY